MVICGPNIIPTASAPPPILQQYSPVLCPVSPIPGVPFPPRYPTITTFIPTNQMVPVSNYGPNYQSHIVHDNQNISIQASIPVPYSSAIPPSSQTTVMPYTTNTVSTIVPCSPSKVSQNENAIIYNDIKPSVTPSSLSNNNSVITTCGPRIIGPAEGCTQDMCTFWTNTPRTVYPTVMSSSTRICQISPNILTVPTWKQSYGMEQVWQQEFKILFSQYAPHVWLLLPINQSPSGVWNSNVDSAKVRFCCEECGHGWTSMKGRVAFWFYLSPAGEGVVCLKLYGQQCDRCKKGNYEPAMWYPEEVIKVLVNIYNRVGQVYYGFQQAPYHRTRRPGKPRTPHNSDLCQACKDGMCSERR